MPTIPLNLFCNKKYKKIETLEKLEAEIGNTNSENLNESRIKSEKKLSNYNDSFKTDD